MISTLESVDLAKSYLEKNGHIIRWKSSIELYIDAYFAIRRRALINNWKNKILAWGKNGR